MAWGSAHAQGCVAPPQKSPRYSSGASSADLGSGAVYRLMCCALLLVACGRDVPTTSLGLDTGRDAGAQSGRGGRGGTAGSTAGAAGAVRRSPLSCGSPSKESVQCGGVTCPTTAELETDPCFVPCCVMFEGAPHCGFRGTSMAFTTECVLPAVADPTCDEIPQFQGCCEPTRHVCGIVGGFAPGCQTKSSFVTLPAVPKACGAAADSDAGEHDTDADAGASR